MRCTHGYSSFQARLTPKTAFWRSGRPREYADAGACNTQLNTDTRSTAFQQPKLLLLPADLLSTAFKHLLNFTAQRHVPSGVTWSRMSIDGHHFAVLVNISLAGSPQIRLKLSATSSNAIPCTHRHQQL
jgi:hypothetical protein